MSASNTDPHLVHRIETELLKNPYVEAAAVECCGNTPSDRTFAAYIVVNIPGLKAQTQTESHKQTSTFVSRWERLYDLTYSRTAPGPNFSGWNSSYTRQAIPLAEMQEWLRGTVQRIRDLRPRNILEIGCGSGLLLQALAPECARYLGTDLSASALSQLQRWKNGRTEFQHIELLHRPATGLQDIEPGSFDTVILNSVIQYFPDVHYLLRVLQTAAAIAGPGGNIFVGDVRHLGLLRVFHSAIQLARAAESTKVAQLRCVIERCILQETELVVDPRLFEQIPGVGRATIQLRRGHAHNELTRYRYDVILRVAGEPTRSVADSVPALIPDIQSLSDIEALMRTQRLPSARTPSMPNARLTLDCLAQQLIAECSSDLTVGKLRDRLSRFSPVGVDPEELWGHAACNGYDAEITWSSDGQPDRIDALLKVQSEGVAVPGFALPISHDPVAPEVCANNPSDNAIVQRFILSLAVSVKQSLPEQLVPATWIAVTRLPMTSAGELDRAAL